MLKNMMDNYLIRAGYLILSHKGDIRIQRGVRQGFVASPILFNLNTEKIFRHIKGVNV